jgi:hypothetical protein
MRRLTTNQAGWVALLLGFSATLPAEAQYGEKIASYESGTTPAPGYTMASAALGEPERFIGGAFPSVVSPFSPPYLTDQIVSIGEGGQITVRLSRYAIPHAGLEIGVFSNVGLVDDDYPNGQATSPATTFGIDSAIVEVSADGVLWSSLGSVAFDIPSSGYTDLSGPYSSTPGSSPSDFQQPFTGTLSSFNGLPYSDAGGPDVRELLAGAGGGKWLDISGTGLARVGYIRFSVVDDLNPGSGRNFELDAVSVAHGSLGGVVPEPASLVPAIIALTAITIRCRRCPSRRLAATHSRQAIRSAQSPGLSNARRRS